MHRQRKEKLYLTTDYDPIARTISINNEAVNRIRANSTKN